jgi:hypothetical protein
VAFGAPLQVGSCQNATVTCRSGPIGVAGPTGVGNEDKPVGDMSGLTPMLVPPPQPATKTDAIADNILRVIGYLLQNMRCKRIAASEKIPFAKNKDTVAIYANKRSRKQIKYSVKIENIWKISNNQSINPFTQNLGHFRHKDLATYWL